MPLTPEDIVRKEFREAFRGYNQADVDLFLDDVVEEFTRLTDDNQKMKVRIAALQQEVARLREGRPPASTSAAAKREDSERIEGEVRQRVRRFLEEQIRLIEGTPTPSPTVERIAREVPPPPPAPSRSEAPPETGKTDDREPFWAGE